MKTKVLMSLALVLGLSLATMAQKQSREMPNPEERAQKMTDKMVEKLSLNEDQKTAVYEANLTLAKEEKSTKEARKAAAEKHDAAIKSTLTDEQYAKFTEMRDKHREKRRMRRAER